VLSAQALPKVAILSELSKFPCIIKQLLCELDGIGCNARIRGVASNGLSLCWVESCGSHRIKCLAMSRKAPLERYCQTHIFCERIPYIIKLSTHIKHAADRLNNPY
jgi:hypothetical protein